LQNPLNITNNNVQNIVLEKPNNSNTDSALIAQQENELYEIFKPLILTKSENDAKTFMTLQKMQKVLTNRETAINSEPTVLPVWANAGVKELWSLTLNEVDRKLLTRMIYNSYQPFDFTKFNRLKENWENRVSHLHSDLIKHVTEIELSDSWFSNFSTFSKDLCKKWLETPTTAHLIRFKVSQTLHENTKELKKKNFEASKKQVDTTKVKHGYSSNPIHNVLKPDTSKSQVTKKVTSYIDCLDSQKKSRKGQQKERFKAFDKGYPQTRENWVRFQEIKKFRNSISSYNTKIKNLSYHNLSTKEVSSDVEEILGLGYKFIPTSSDLTKKEITDSFDKFSNRILWTNYFLQKGDTSSDKDYNPKLRTKPVLFDNSRPILDETPFNLSLLKKDLLNAIDTIPASQFNQSTHQIISDFRSRGDIKIVSSDKGLGLVTMDTDQYHEMVMSHLSDTKTYKKICKTSDSVEIKSIFTKVRAKHDGITKHLARSNRLTAQELKFLNEKRECSFPAFHCLPKLHKAGPLKGRPIVGATNWETTPLSILLASWLETRIMSRFPFTLKNSNALMKDLELEGDVAEKLLFTLDVSSLYTNIDIALLCRALEDIDPIFAMIAYFICNNNYLEYKDHIYQQISGIAMGTNVAVAMANLYLGIYIDPLLASKMHFYRRFIDDIFGLYSKTKTDLEHQIVDWNNLLQDIKFTHSISKDSVDFLDITIFKDPIDQKTLVTKSYHKTISKFLYLPFNSLHPQSTYKGLIIGMLKRFEETCTFQTDYEFNRDAFGQRLRDRGYPNDVLVKYFSLYNPTRYKVVSETNNPLLSYPIQRTLSNKQISIRKNRIPFILPYTNTPRHKAITDIIKRSSNLFPVICKHYNISPTSSSRPNIGRLTLRSKLSKEQVSFLDKLDTSKHD
jgi:hypothetical protein